MKKQEKARKTKSLQGRVFRISLIGALILGVVALLIGLGIYAVVLADQYITKAFNLSNTTSVVIEEVIDMADITNSVMSIYHGLSEEERNSPEDRTYIDRTQASLDACVRPMYVVARYDDK